MTIGSAWSLWDGGLLFFLRYNAITRTEPAAGRMSVRRFMEKIGAPIFHLDQLFSHNLINLDFSFLIFSVATQSFQRIQS